MRKTQSRAWLALSSRGWLAGALLVVAAVMTACVAPSAPQATPAVQTTTVAVTPGAATQPAAQATTASGPAAPAATAELGSQEAGQSANLNPAAKYVTHWKGDPNAKVVIIEISDFQ
jgi:hypothetical protein